MLDRLPLPPNDKWKEGVWDLDGHTKRERANDIFRAAGTDHQTSHDEDEYYFIVSGSGDLVVGDESFSFVTGDAFFVPAKVPHRFSKFSDDFACWAVFF